MIYIFYCRKGYWLSNRLTCITAGFNFAVKTYTDTYPLITATRCNQKQRAVLVSGASKGIGRAIAVSFAQAGAAHIALGARSTLDDVELEVLDAAKQAGHSAPHILKLSLDVTNESSVAEAVKQTEMAFGRLDMLINNAGRLETWRPIADSEPASWWETWEVNVKGTYLMTRAFLPLLLKGGEKTIINLGSIGAHLTRPTASAYQSSKLALLRLTQFTAAEYEKDGILAYVVHPGAVPTEMVLLNLPPQFRHKAADKPELAGDSIVWLTQERREWLSGRYLSASWDLEEIMSRQDEIISQDKLKVRLVL
jgi:NAD(P)-dependent dehydrogenase (short-subunit alcohol dehydrogenase family)